MCHSQIVQLSKVCKECADECRDGLYHKEKGGVEPGERESWGCHCGSGGVWAVRLRLKAAEWDV